MGVPKNSGLWGGRGGGGRGQVQINQDRELEIILYNSPNYLLTGHPENFKNKLLFLRKTKFSI